jgi:ADP-ribose pyrophosphatase
MHYQIDLKAAETGFDRFLQLKSYRLTHSLYAGGMSPELVRERLERLRAVAVLPYDPVTDRVVLVEQFRIGALEQGPGAWLLEIVGGMWDPGHSADQVARKETREEAGCELGPLMPIGDVWMSPGTSCERVMLYCGRVDAATAGGIYGVAAEGEDIKVVTLAFDEAMELAASGGISAATALIALYWLAANRPRVRAAWR